MVAIKEHNQRYLEAMNYIMESRGMTMESFAKSLEITRTILSQVKGGKQNASIDVVSKTVSVYPELNADYIITGRGSMFIQEQENKANDKSNEKIIIELQEELKDVYGRLKAAHQEIGELSMRLKAAEEHSVGKKIG